MLTPLDIQQKKFKAGLGFDKKDVQAFFDEVSKSYGELYRSNAELKEKVITLTDTVQHYKATENELNKKLLLTDKNIFLKTRSIKKYIFMRYQDQLLIN